MIKLTDKPLASSSASGDKIFINRNGAIMQVGMSNFSPPIVPTVSGNVIAVTDSSDRPLVDLTVFGNTSQNGTPTPENPIDLNSVENPVVTINGKNLLKIGRDAGYTETNRGIVYTIKEDKSISVSGTPNDTTNWKNLYLEAFKFSLPEGNYKFACKGLKNSSKLYPLLYHRLADGTAKAITSFLEKQDGEVSFTITDENKDNIYLVIACSPDYTPQGERLYISIFPENVTDLSYEPYKAQSISIPYTLNAIGEVKDYVDFERGVFVKKINAITPKTVITGYPTANGESFVAVVATEANYTDNTVVNDVMCDYLPTVSSNSQYISNESSVSCGSSRVMITIKDVTNKADVEQWLNDNPITILYIPAQPTETPLTAEEIEAFKQLTSYYPVTTITNSENAEMSVEYVADTKNYIDQKLASLVASATTDTTEV